MVYAGMVSIPSPKEDEVIETKIVKKTKEAYPGYTLLGNGRATRNGGYSMDILDICAELNTAEMKLLKFLRDEVDRNKMAKEKNVNLVKPTRSHEWTDYLKIAMKKNYSHMECVGIIKRVRRGTYMMNPYVLIPTKDFEYHAKEWEVIEGKMPDEEKQ